MIQFQSDYSEGAHEKVLEKLLITNREQTGGYGNDPYCEKAKGLIQELCQAPDAEVHFLMGGTQTNITLISAALRTYQGVLCPDSAHINVHETGAIEACGHKVIALDSPDGKITATQVKEYYLAHISDESFEHTVQPKLVYVSQPTELGTLYTKQELVELYKVCKENGMFFYIDGARLIYGLKAEGNDVFLSDLPQVCDAFYIGGTKAGTLFGEALVIINSDLKKDFRYIIKQKGGLLAKGRLLGLQFLGLLEDGLFMQLSAHANQLANRIRNAFQEAGVPFLVESNTNQLFPILEDRDLDELRKTYGFSYQCRVDETHSAVRFCTSWATREEDVDRLVQDINTLRKVL